MSVLQTHSCPFSWSTPPRLWCSLVGPQGLELLVVVLLVLLEPGLPRHHLAVGHNTVHSMLPMLRSGLPLPYLQNRGERKYKTRKKKLHKERFINRKRKKQKLLTGVLWTWSLPLLISATPTLRTKLGASRWNTTGENRTIRANTTHSSTHKNTIFYRMHY